MSVKQDVDGLCKFKNILVNNLYVGTPDNHFEVKEVKQDELLDTKLTELEEKIENITGTDFMEIKEPVVIEKRYFIENKNHIPVDDQVKIQLAEMLANDVKRDIDECNTNILQVNADQKNLHAQFESMNNAYKEIIEGLTKRIDVLEKTRPSSATSGKKISFNDSGRVETILERNKRLASQKKA